MKTRFLILTLTIVLAVSARTNMRFTVIDETLSAMTSQSVPKVLRDTLNKDVISSIPPKPNGSRHIVPVMAMPTSEDFIVADNEDDDEYFDDTDMQPTTPVRRRLNMTDPEWLADLQMRVDSVARKSRSYQKTYTTTTGRGRHKRTVTHSKTIEQTFTMGCCIFDLTADSIIYSLNEDKMMKPASTQKLFTAVAALSTLGYKFDFKTEVTTNGRLMKDSVDHRYLKGDIYIQGNFDPTLDKVQIHQIARAIEKLGIDSIDGRIIADGHRKGSLFTGDGSGSHPERSFATSVFKELKKDSISFSYSEPWDVSVEAIHGKQKIITIDTPLAQVLQRMLKRSNNTYAESVFQNLCKDDNSWSYDRCRDTVSDLVKSLKAPKRKGTEAKNYSEYYSIVDGCGLSHYNRTSAETQVMLLRYAYHNRNVFGPLYDNLPIAGVDGTISKRMRAEPTYNNVHAKTGTINEVSTLSGYVTAANGHQLAFAILVNETTKSNGHNIQDDICLELAR